MQKIEFKNLPNTDTPITAENLNAIQDNMENEINDSSVVVSAEEPTTNRKKVWMQKGKNLFNGKLEVGAIDSETGQNNTNLNAKRNIGYIEVLPNTSYTFSLDISDDGTGIRAYDINKEFVSTIATINNGDKTVTFTTTSEIHYIRFATWSSATKFQLEQGSTATDYEAYIEPKIYIKNNNDVYEEFKNDEEIKKELKEKNFLSITGDLVSALSYNTSNLHDLQALRLNYSDTVKLNINGTEYSGASSVVCFSISCSDNVNFQLGVVTWCGTASIRGKIIYRYSHGANLSNSWKVLN